MNPEHIPAGWGWHPDCTVDHVQAVQALQAIDTETRRGEPSRFKQGRQLPAVVVERICAYAQRGDKPKEIGRRLGISARTVTRHLNEAEAA